MSQKVEILSKIDIKPQKNVVNTTVLQWGCLFVKHSVIMQNRIAFKADEYTWALVAIDVGSTNLKFGGWGKIWFLNDHFVKIPFEETKDKRFDMRVYLHELIPLQFPRLTPVIPVGILKVWKDFFEKGCPEDYDSELLNKTGTYRMFGSGDSGILILEKEYQFVK